VDYGLQIIGTISMIMQACHRRHFLEVVVVDCCCCCHQSAAKLNLNCSEENRIIGGGQ
jgi:hypothetical protein